MSSEQNLKKVLGFKEVLSIAMGQTIGSGVMAMTGIAIGMTGRGVVLAYILSSVFVVFMSIPTMMMGSALPTTGGAYRYASRLGHPVAGLVYMLIYLAYNITLALFALSFADYMQSLIPGVPFKLCAAGILTLMYVTNLFGMQWAAKLQNLMVVVMIIAFAVFIGNGMPQVDFSAFSSMEQLAPNGFVTLITTAGLLTFATGGANVVASLGSEMKNPGRDIPLGMAVGTLAVGVIYAFMALIASGVLPVEQVANQNLSVVAREILSKPLFVFFIVGGAMFAIATTLNSTMSWVTKPVMAACADGWFPKGLAAVNEKFGTPHILLTIFYFVGLIPILLDIPLGMLGTLGSGISLFMALIPMTSSYWLHKKYPEAAAKAPFRLKPGTAKVTTTVALILCAI
ncbi:MAG: amino acid permease [Clostridia bacterium]|nr:amino acid permease [Clostridia bacterium]